MTLKEGKKNILCSKVAVEDVFHLRQSHDQTVGVHDDMAEHPRRDRNL